MQHLQNCAAGYVLGKYTDTLDLINLNWLSVAGNKEFKVSKVACQGLHDKNWSEYLPINFIKRRRSFRSEKSRPMININTDGETNTFQQQAEVLSSEVFSTLPVRIWKNNRICENKQSLSIRIIEVFIRIKPWLEYCPHKVFSVFFFSFGLFEIFVQLFNFSLSG